MRSNCQNYHDRQNDCGDSSGAFNANVNLEDTHTLSLAVVAAAAATQSKQPK